MNALRKWLQQLDFTTPKHLEVERGGRVTLPTIRPLASLLPYRRFEEGTHLFINQGSYGFLLETTPLLGADENTCQILGSLITQGLPQGAVLQFFQWSSPRIAPLLSAWQQLRSGKGELYAKLAQRRVDFLSQGAHQSLLPGSHYHLRQYRTCIAVSFSGIPSDFEQKAAISLQKTLMNTLRSIHCQAEWMEPNGFLSLMEEWVNPSFTLSPFDARWNEHDPLHWQLTSPESVLGVFD